MPPGELQGCVGRARFGLPDDNRCVATYLTVVMDALRDDAVGPPPPTGEAREIRPGLFWVRMPLPFALDHINLWLLHDGDGFTLIDTGIATAEVREAWDRLAATMFDRHRPRRLVCTHFHPDHMGLAGWLADRWGLQTWATLGEWAFGRMLSLEDDAPFNACAIPFYQSAGFDADRLRRIEQRGNAYRQRVAPLPPTFRRLRHGEQLRIGDSAWEVIVASGHSPEHACLYCPERSILIAGDQILPKISPNISVWPQEPEGDPLALYLESLPQFGRLPAHTLVLPSHHQPFLGLHARLSALTEHHRHRLDETFAACARPCTAAQALEVLFRRRLDDHQLVFAVGEALAHLRYLQRRGRLLEETRGDVRQFRHA